MRASKTFARHKGLLACVLLSVGLLLSACVLLAFYCSDPESVEDAIRRLIGSGSDDDFVLPSRERPELTGEEEVEQPSARELAREWFTSRGANFHSAILVAGSSGYSNYRHQADVCHAFQILKKGGVLEDNIITFVADDIAFNKNNPYKGQIFNKPGGQNVYPGCAKDYTGRDVNPSTLLAVFRGDRGTVAGRGSGRVLKKDPSQKVFFFYSDHGSVGTIAMPYGGVIFADHLHKTLSHLAQNNHFDQMLIYLEACESGSMFRGFGMDKQEKILAVTASDAHESSYATYCPSYGYQTRYIEPTAEDIGSCLGDLFSVSWMEHTETHDTSEVFINDQLDHVRYRTSDSGSYFAGSHMKKYGDKKGTIISQVIGNFQSYFLAPPDLTRSDAKRILEGREQGDAQHVAEEGDASNSANRSTIDFTIDQRSADLLYLYHGAMDNDDEAERELQAELGSRKIVDTSIRAAVADLIQQDRLSSVATVDDYVTTEVNPRPQVQIVKDWACLRAAVNAWEDACTPMSSYAWKYTIAFANLCNEGISVDEMTQAFARNCQLQKVS